MNRTRQFNSSLHNVSKKRQAEMSAGTWKPKIRAPIKKMSAKTKRRIDAYREAAFQRWGVKCFLCDRIGPKIAFDIHHIDGRENGDNPERMVPLCNKRCGCRAHDHCGKDIRFFELKGKIENKMKLKE